MNKQTLSTFFILILSTLSFQLTNAGKKKKILNIILNNQSLCIAVQTNSYSIVKNLIACGADITTINDDGKNLLQLTTSSFCAEILCKEMIKFEHKDLIIEAFVHHMHKLNNMYVTKEIFKQLKHTSYDKEYLKNILDKEKIFVIIKQQMEESSITGIEIITLLNFYNKELKKFIEVNSYLINEDILKKTYSKHKSSNMIESLINNASESILKKCYHGLLENLRYNLSLGIYNNKEDYKKLYQIITILLKALRNKNIDIISCDNVNSFLFETCRNGFNTVKAFVDHEIKFIEIKNKNGNTLLDIASKQNRTDIVKYLLKKGALEVTNKNPLKFTASKSCAKLLCEEMIKTNNIENIFEAFNNQVYRRTFIAIEILKTLHFKGFDIDELKNKKEESLLKLAIKKANRHDVLNLIETGIDPFVIKKYTNEGTEINTILSDYCKIINDILLDIKEKSNAYFAYCEASLKYAEMLDKHINIGFTCSCEFKEKKLLNTLSKKYNELAKTVNILLQETKTNTKQRKFIRTFNGLHRILHRKTFNENQLKTIEEIMEKDKYKNRESFSKIVKDYSSKRLYIPNHPNNDNNDNYFNNIKLLILSEFNDLQEIITKIYDYSNNTKYKMSPFRENGGDYPFTRTVLNEFPFEGFSEKLKELEKITVNYLT